MGLLYLLLYDNTNTNSDKSGNSTLHMHDSLHKAGHYTERQRVRVSGSYQPEKKICVAVPKSDHIKLNHELCNLESEYFS
jgi:hypothetical protein